MFSKALMTAIAFTALTANASSDKMAKPAAKAVEMKIVTESSKVEWAATKKVGSGHAGLVPVKQGSVKMDGSKLVGGEIVIDMTKIAVTDIPATDENNKKLVGHLTSADFFDAQKNPEAKLTILSSKELSPGKLEVTGELEIKKQKQPVTFPVEVKMDKGMAMASGKLTLDRTKFGIKYASGNFFKLAADKVINDNFDLTFNVTAKN